ncbi:hypothetical protein JCM10908_006966 [Rhodotorula pacifica]|uniref:uncharacterized protein n=1 Tax=Rhodotorula pacifica TaxID=1495444 RepID=UPI0031818406
MQSPLAAAFDYPVRQDSLARKKSTQQHAQQKSTSSTASSASSSAASTSGFGLGGLGRGRGRGASAHTHAYGYSSSSAHTRSSSIATDLTTASSSSCGSGTGASPFSFQDENKYGLQAHEHISFQPDLREEDEDDEDQIPRTDSTLLLRERTRYRSSASYAPIATTYPLQGAFGSLSISGSSSLASPFDQDEEHDAVGSSENAHMELLAALAATSTTLDTCFCGNAPEEDSIYCSRACAQADALNALCGGTGSGSSGGEDGGAGSISDAASLRSNASLSSSSGAESSHYRRVEKEETRRATEKERALRRLKSSRKPVPKLKADDDEVNTRMSSNASSTRSSSSSRPAPSASAGRTSSSASSRRTPSLSHSSLASEASRPSSSSFHLPASPLRNSVSSPCIVEPASPLDHHDDENYAIPPSGLGFEHPIRPCTPSPRIGTTSNDDGSMLVSDIYASYLTATPRDGQQHLLQTPTSHHLAGLHAPDSLATTPRAVYLAAQGGARQGGEEEDDEESPTQHCGTSSVGLRMLELCDSDEGEDVEEEEEAEQGSSRYPVRHEDEARDSLGRGGLSGGQRMQQRMAERTSSSSSSSSTRSSSASRRIYGHMRGKLSFDDVVGILGA